MILIDEEVLKKTRHTIVTKRTYRLVDGTYVVRITTRKRNRRNGWVLYGPQH